MSYPTPLPSWCYRVSDKQLCRLAVAAWTQTGMKQYNIARALGCSASALSKALAKTAPESWVNNNALTREQLECTILFLGIPPEWWVQDLTDIRSRLEADGATRRSETSNVEASLHQAVLANARHRKKSLLYVAPHHGGYLSTCLERVFVTLRVAGLEWPFTELRVLVPDPNDIALRSHPSDTRLWRLGEDSRLYRNLSNIADLFGELNGEYAVPIRCRYYSGHWGYICTAFDGFAMATVIPIGPRGLLHPGHSHVPKENGSLCRDLFSRFESEIDWTSPNPFPDRRGWL